MKTYTLISLLLLSKLSFSQKDTSELGMYWNNQIGINIDFQSSKISFSRNDTVYFSLFNKGSEKKFLKGDSFFLFIQNEEFNTVDVIKYYFFKDFAQNDTLYYRLLYPCMDCVSDSKGNIQHMPQAIRLTELIRTAQQTLEKVHKDQLNRKEVVIAFTEDINARMDVLANKCLSGFEFFVENTLSSSQLTFNLCTELVGNLPWRITDARGRTIHAGSIEKTEIRQDFLIYFESLEKGNYTLIVGSRGDTFSSNFKVTW